MIKSGIRNKLSFVVITAISLLGLCLLTVSFFGIRRLRLDTLGQRQQWMAEAYSVMIAQQIDREIHTLKAYMASPRWQEAVHEANLRYAHWEPKAIEDYMARMDRQWVPAAADTPVIRELLNSPMSLRLQALAKRETELAEIFLTDQYGGLIAASGKTSDFYQADELWWQQAYHNKLSHIFFGNLEVDTSINKISASIAIPFEDHTGRVTGILKTVLDISLFFLPLDKFELNETRQVELIDSQGNVVFHPTLKPMTKSELSVPDLERILKMKGSFSLVTGGFKTRTIAAAARIRSHPLEANGLHWIVVVTQSEKAAFSPMYSIFRIVLLLMAIVSIVIIFLLKRVIQTIFVAPLLKIQEGAQHFSEGDLDYRISVKSTDEFQILARSLNEMSDRLNQSMVSRDHFAMEVLEREKAQQALRESEKRFFDVFYSSVSALLLISGSKFVNANDATAQMLAYPNRTEFLKKHPSELSPPTQPDGRSSFEKSEEMIRLAFKKGFHQFEWIHRRADGVDLPVQVSLTPITLQSERILHCAWTDLTQQKNDEKILSEFQNRLKEQAAQLADSLAESRKSREILSSMLEDNNETKEALEKSLRELKATHDLLAHAEKMEAIGRMASGVAHEVKNPLGVILQGINYFEDMLPPEEKHQRETLQMMKNNVKRADKIVRGLLDFSRAQETHMEPQDINTILKSSLALVEHNLKLHAVEAVCELEDHLPQLPLDTGKIEQVFVNLFNNAVDAMPSGGKFYIRSYFSEMKSLENKAQDGTGAILKLRGRAVIVEVEDTGVGIDESIIKNVFDPFFTTKNRTEGTGLGLSIARSIIEMHEGLINIESKKGSGTKFTVAFKIP